MSAFCLLCQTPESAHCARCGGIACGRCDACHGCGRVVCYQCDTQPTPRFDFPGDAYRHPHNESRVLVPVVMLS